jgi:heat shock protein HslJ
VVKVFWFIWYNKLGRKMKRLSAHITVLLALLLAAGLAGCNGGGTPADETPVELDGTQWALRSIHGKWALRSIHGGELVKGSHISLYFRDGSFWGSAGCNIYGGDYSTEAPDILIIPGVGRTMAGCPPPEGAMEQQEDAYIDSLCNAAFYHATSEHLEISDSANQWLLLFDRKPEYPMEPADLVGTSWLLVSTDGEYVTEGLSITLSFDSDSVASGRAGCFDYELHYKASGDDIRWGMSAHRDGELSLELEHEALQYTYSIMEGANYRLAEGRLEIFTARGETLVYEPLGD